MNFRIENYPSNYLLAAFLVSYAIATAELLDINRIPRTFVHRDYFLFEVVFALALWLCTLGSLHLEAAFGQRSAVASLAYRLLSGFLSGVTAMAALLGISLATRTSGAVVGYLSSWQCAADFLWAATLTSFGWFIGAISGAARFLTAMQRKGWLLAFAVLCVVVRVGLLLSHASLAKLDIINRCGNRWAARM